MDVDEQFEYEVRRCAQDLRELVERRDYPLSRVLGLLCGVDANKQKVVKTVITCEVGQLVTIDTTSIAVEPNGEIAYTPARGLTYKYKSVSKRDHKEMERRG